MISSNNKMANKLYRWETRISTSKTIPLWVKINKIKITKNLNGNLTIYKINISSREININNINKTNISEINNSRVSSTRVKVR